MKECTQGTWVVHKRNAKNQNKNKQKKNYILKLQRSRESTKKGDSKLLVDINHSNRNLSIAELIKKP
jgi:hypothetical protein